MSALDDWAEVRTSTGVSMSCCNPLRADVHHTLMHWVCKNALGSGGVGRRRGGAPSVADVDLASLQRFLPPVALMLSSHSKISLQPPSEGTSGAD